MSICMFLRITTNKLCKEKCCKLQLGQGLGGLQWEGTVKWYFLSLLYPHSTFLSFPPSQLMLFYNIQYSNLVSGTIDFNLQERKKQKPKNALVASKLAQHNSRLLLIVEIEGLLFSLQESDILQCSCHAGRQQSLPESRKSTLHFLPIFQLINMFLFRTHTICHWKRAVKFYRYI